jgi:hypothetical protein
MAEAKAPEQAEERYPAIEEFIAHASADDISELFLPVREGLDWLKGPRAEQGKRVRAALDRAEELLQLLLETRKKLEARPRGRR